MAYDEATAARVRRRLGAHKGTTEKTLMGGRSFMIDGAMCCSVSGRGGLLVRVLPEAYAAALAQSHVEPMAMGQRVMRGFVRVMPEGYRTDAQLDKWLDHGIAAAKAQPPKPARPKARRRTAA